ncbi:MAG: DUF126 domain-containing protein [Thermomicrobiales bacterium]
MVELNEIRGQVIVPRQVQGTVLAADVPLSFWGGYDPDTGAIIDQRHPLAGEMATGCVLVIPGGRGSCSGSGVLFEAIRNGTAPAAIVMSQIDPIIGLGAVLGDELFDTAPAVIVIDEQERRRIATGDMIQIDASGAITVARLTGVAPDADTR